MRIGIDARLIPYKQKDGIAYYSLYLIENLLKIDQANDYSLFYNLFMQGDRNLAIDLSGVANAKNKVFLIPGRIIDWLWTKMGMPDIEFFLGKLDIFHTLSFTSIPPYFYIPPQRAGKRVVTIHDIFPIQFPQEASSVYNIKEYKIGLDNVIKKADAIICVSESEKNDLLKFTNVAGDKVFVVHSGITDDFYKCSDAARIKNVLGKYNIKDKYILNVSNLDYKKNIVNLIKAFHIFRKNYNFKLVITGRKGNAWQKVFSTIDRLNLSNEVIYLDYVNKDDLIVLLSAAEAFVFPSVYESFGFPNLEAMKCETPVVSSSIDAIKEIVGDAALLADPNSPEAIADAISRLLSNDGLRKDLILKGKERVKLFSWENTARNTLEVYRKAVGK